MEMRWPSPAVSAGPSSFLSKGLRLLSVEQPLAALRGPTADGGTVLVAQDGRAVLREVRLGLRSLAAAEVVKGLAAGELVLLGASVQPGQRVRPRPEPWSAAEPLAAASGRGEGAAALSNAMGR